MARPRHDGPDAYPVETAATSQCPGCGLVLPKTGWTLDRPFNASGECWQVHADVVGFELSHADLVREFHQLTVDAYGAQHAGGATPLIRVGYSLVGLYAALEHGWSGVRVRDLHQRMGKPDRSWPVFVRPSHWDALTIADVATAGVRAGSVAGHADAVARWAHQVWRAWSDQRGVVADFSARFGVPATR